MNLDKLESAGQDDNNFQNASTGNQGQNPNSSSTDHPCTDNAEPDYGNDLNTEEISREFDNENLADGLDPEEFGSEENNTEFDTHYNNDELGSEKLDDEGLDDPDYDKRANLYKSF